MDEGRERARSEWVEAFDEGRDDILSRIRDARKVSDAGVVAAGERINAIVRAARSYIDKVEASLQDTGQSEIERLVEQVRTTVVDQHGMVRQALEHSEDIKKAGAAIEGAASASRLLALNARVEASRLSGTDKAAFDVIAEEVRDLSEEIAKANHRIDGLIDRLLGTLPRIAEEAESARGTVDLLHHEQGERHRRLQAEVESRAQEGKAAVETVLQEARSALSELQFQDPMIQSIEGIDRILVKIRNALVIAAGDGQAAEAAYDPHLSDDVEPTADGVVAVDAGELLLF